MSTPEPPSGPPAEAGGPDAPGHRARALAASLLGELTGQRKSGLTFSPLEPSGLAVTPRDSGTAPTSPPDPAAPAPTTDEDDAPAVPTVARGPVPVLEPEPPRLTVAPEPEDRDEEPDAPTGSSTVSPTATAAGSGSGPDRDADGPAAEPPAPPRPAEVPPPAPLPTPATPPAGAPQQAAPQQAPTRVSTPSAATGPVPSTGAALAPAAPAPSAPARPQQSEGGSAPSQDVRPAPFAYLAVAQHHTTPARATANGALDQAGQRISSRVDRALVRRAALVTMEAASLLDACDVLDGRARAADATWNGDHHSPTEVREFEGAWGAFYDAQGALAQHVTS